MSAPISKKIIEKCIKEQIRLSSQVKQLSLNISEGFVAGIDVSYKGEDIFCSIVVLYYPQLKIKNIYRCKDKVRFPYVPGLLSFREMPIVLKTFKYVKEDVFLILCDGQGIAHPRGFGLASHIGTELKKPTIGCAKSRLIGEYNEPGPKKGDYSPLVYKEKIVGVVLRTRDNTKPLFISVGNYIDLDSSIRYVLRCSRYRIPEPTRLAHQYVTEYKNQYSLCK